MGNLSNYLSWRGDLDFRDYPFSEVDGLILSVLAGLNLDGIVPGRGSGEAISIRKASEKYYSADDIRAIRDEDADGILFSMAQSIRFGDSVLRDYLKVEGDWPFSAITVSLADGTSFIGFAMPSDTLSDWQRIFAGSCILTTAHREAVRYAEEVLSHKRSLCRLGGVGGGGTLALYASAMCRDTLKPMILVVYMNDSPGLSPDLYPAHSLSLINERCSVVMPEYSVLGTLFTPNVRPLIVKSSARDILMADPMTWQIAGDRFLTTRRLDSESAACSEILDGWIEISPPDDRLHFIKDLFNSLKMNGARNLKDVSGSGLDSFYTVLRSLTTSESRTRIVAGNILNTFFQRAKAIRPGEAFTDSEALFALALLALGIVLTLAPAKSLKLIALIASLGVLIFSMLGILSAAVRDMSPSAKRRQVLIYMLVLCVSVAFITNLSRLALISGFIVGAVFSGIALIILIRLIRLGEMKPSTAAQGLLALALAAIGVVCASASDLLAGRSASLGLVLVLIALILIVHALIRNADFHAVKK